MNITYPYTIENCIGERLIFKGLQKGENDDRLIVENYVAPGCGPVMHIHWLQDECLTVVKGRIGYEVKGQPKRYAAEGESVLFKRGVAHRFWNAGDEVLHCTGWINPPNTIVFYLSSIYAAQNKSGKGRPELFDGAYLMTRYASEYDVLEIPGFVKKVVMPVLCWLGKLLGKYKHFQDAPEAVGR